MKTRAALVIVFVFAFSLFPMKAKANNIADAALTVLIGSGVGAVLGLSTLPFYSEMGQHTQNIWIGAAVGAVIGVGISVAEALRTTDKMEFEDDYQEAEKRDFSILSSPNSQLGIASNTAPTTTALSRKLEKNSNEMAFVVPVRILTF